MVKHAPVISPLSTPEDLAKFADEVLGTATEQVERWFKREIEWRANCVDQYNREIKALIERRDDWREQARKPTGPNPVVSPALDPNATQEFSPVESPEDQA
jgi:hypothetical protein